MLKQLSVTQKIFGTTTLLLGMCYVGVLVYVQGAFAAGNPDWVQYNATVVNIMKVNPDSQADKEYKLNTKHGVYYDNTDNASSARIRIKGVARWFKNGHSLIDPDDRITAKTIAGGSEGWYGTTRSKNQHITGGTDQWIGQAYTNLLNNDWETNAQGASGVNTEHFNHDNYEPDPPDKRPFTEVYSTPVINNQ